VISLLIRRRFVLFSLVALAMLALLSWGRHVRYEQSIQSFFADDDPAVISYKRAASLFGSDQFVFLCYDDPELLSAKGMDRVAELAGAIGPDQIDGVVRVESLEAMPLLWKVDDSFLALNQVDVRIEQLGDSLAGRLARATRDRLWKALKDSIAASDATRSELSVGTAIRKATAEERAEIGSKLTRHPLFQGTVIDATGTTTALIARLKAPEDHDVKQTIRNLRREADAFASRHHLEAPAVVGPPVLLADGFEAIEIDGRRLAMVGMALIGLVTLSATRSFWWALVPMIAGWTIWVTTDTILSLLDLRLALSGGPLVAQIIVLTMPAASHLALHFQDDLRRHLDRWEAARETLSAVSGPILWCALTGAVGYGALLTSNVVPVRQFGTVLAIASASAAVLTLAISPFAMLPPFHQRTSTPRPNQSLTGHAMNRLTGWVVRHPATIVLGLLAVVAPIVLGLVRVQYESNYIHAFKPGARVVRDYLRVERKLGGIGLVGLVVPTGESLDPETLRRFRELETEIREIRPLSDGSPAVTQALSLASVLDPDGQIGQLDPRSQARVLSAKLELIEASPQSDLLRGFWNPEQGAARVVIRLPESQQAPTKVATFRRALEKARDQFGPEVELTGLSHLLTLTTAGVIRTQWTTVWWATGGLLLTLTLAFRGPKLAALAILPTLLSVGMVLGLMGWIGVKLDLATALVGSVALGLSVDDTFHCLLQYRRQPDDHSFAERLFSSYSVTGPGVLLSSLAVAVGFSVLRFSEFVPFSNFGAMVAIATLGSSLGNLIFLPACLSLGHRLKVGLTRKSVK
jgi:hypothetical protein